jgi:glycosyltransferase involved in cell wall biosynthesis
MTLITDVITDISSDEVKIISLAKEKRNSLKNFEDLAYAMSRFAVSAAYRLHDFKNMRYICRVEKFLMEFLKHNRVDVIHSHFAWPYGSGGSLAKKKYTIPLVITLRGIDILKEESIGYGWRLDRFYEDILRKTLSAAERITVASSLTYKACVDFGISKDKIALVPNGVDTELFSPVSNPEGLKSKMKLEGRPFVLSVGHFTPRKGYNYLIETACLVSKEIPHVYFLIIGRGSLKKTMEEAVVQRGLGKNMGIIEMVPPPEMPFYYRACDIFCTNSLMEGFGNVTIEAMACGKPVIGTRSGGTSDIVVDGKTGYLVEPKSPADMAKKIIHLIKEPSLRADMGRESRDRTERLYKLSTKAKAYYSLYREICN